VSSCCKQYSARIFSPKRVCPPPNQMVGGTLKPAAKGVGKSQFGRLEKKLSTLSTLWPAPNPVYSRLLEGFSSNSDVCMCLAYVTTDSAVHSLICSVQYSVCNVFFTKRYSRF
jgi:hypothetical protein